MKVMKRSKNLKAWMEEQHGFPLQIRTLSPTQKWLVHRKFLDDYSWTLLFKVHSIKLTYGSSRVNYASTLEFGLS